MLALILKISHHTFILHELFTVLVCSSCMMHSELGPVKLQVSMLTMLV